MPCLGRRMVPVLTPARVPQRPCTTPGCGRPHHRGALAALPLVRGDSILYRPAKGAMWDPPILWHYANCFVDGDHLLAAHSINKEDIGVAIVDMTKVE